MKPGIVSQRAAVWPRAAAKTTDDDEKAPVIYFDPLTASKPVCRTPRAGIAAVDGNSFGELNAKKRPVANHRPLLHSLCSERLCLSDPSSA